MKKIILFILIIFISGCAADYNLEISNNQFKEKINFTIPLNQPTNQNIYETYTNPETGEEEEIELDNQYQLILDNQYPVLFSNNNLYYNKKVVNYGDYIDVEMTYKYTTKQFKDSNSLNLCFEDFIFDDQDSYYIHAYGEFYCLYSDEININIKTNNKVIRSNATNVKDNIYTWKINALNSENIDIEFEVSKGFPWKNVIKFSFIIGIAVIIIFLIAYFIYNKNRKNNLID